MADDDWGLTCIHCQFVFPIDITVGVMAAHFDAEHQADKVHVELVPLCPRCNKPMTFERELGPVRHLWGCDPCHRSRVVRQGGDTSA